MERSRNPRGQGERLRDEIVAGAIRLLDELGDDEALSLRAVAREIGVAAPSVYIHFANRDALVLAVMERCHAHLVAAGEEAEASAPDPAARLRRRAVLHVEWALGHPGLYKVLHESALNRRLEMPFKDDLAARTTAAIRACMDAGQAPPGDAERIALDLRTALYGMSSLRVNQPGVAWPPVEEQVDRFLAGLVGV